MSVTSGQLNVNAGDHAVHFYRDDPELADTVGRYLTDALGESTVAVVIATAPHIKAVKRQLAASGTDVEGAQQSGRLIILDAEETLAELTAGGRIDRRAFDNEVGAVVRGAVAAGGSVRAYGEMVDLLWQAGDIGAAIELERLWNELIDELRFSLLCSYQSATAAAPEHEHAVREICHLHSAVSSAPAAGAAVSQTHATWPEFSREFEPEDDAPRAARRFAEEVLQRLGHPRTQVDRARLLLSELVTNAVKHGRSSFVVSIHAQDASVRLAVHDQSPAQPAPRCPAHDTASGRGLQIVAALSSNWGVETATGGKTVWAEI